MIFLQYGYKSGNILLADLDPEHFITNKKQVVYKPTAYATWRKPIEAFHSGEHLELTDEEYSQLIDYWKRWSEFLKAQTEEALKRASSSS